MADFIDNITLFLQQQIELYGDDVCTCRNKNDSQSTAVSLSAVWQDAGSLDELENRINTCQKCVLGHSRHKFVFGSGNPQADIFFIGEAPGADEDRMGLPFVGKAGELLTKMLAAIQIKRADVYIGNILKCRPPQNRDPLPDEIAICKPYLFKQLQLVQPKIIVCLGRISAQTLFETNESLTQLRGRWLSFQNIDLMVTYHPAALLRNPGYKKETWEDLKRLQQHYKNIIGARS